MTPQLAIGVKTLQLEKPDQDLKEHLTRYHQGTCTPREKEIVEKWFLAVSNHEDHEATDSATEDDRLEMLAGILSKIQADESSESLTRRKLIYRSVRIAASLLLFGAGITAYMTTTQKQEITYVVYQNPPDQRSTIDLPDGTRIWLSEASSLKSPEVFDSETREVYLEGEAFFEVAHDEKHPFVIHAGGFSTRVLGTSFSIQARKRLSEFKVAVATGKVMVSDEQKTLGTLTANSQIVYDKVTGKAVVSASSPGLTERWKNGDILLEAVSMEDLGIVLENTFGVSVSWKKEELKTARITIQFNEKDSLNDVLDQVELIHNLKYTLTNKQLRFME